MSNYKTVTSALVTAMENPQHKVVVEQGLKVMKPERNNLLTSVKLELWRGFEMEGTTLFWERHFQKLNHTLCQTLKNHYFCKT